MSMTRLSKLFENLKLVEDFLRHVTQQVLGLPNALPLQPPAESSTQMAVLIRSLVFTLPYQVRIRWGGGG
jgi:hypothetical protein